MAAWLVAVVVTTGALLASDAALTSHAMSGRNQVVGAGGWDASLASLNDAGAPLIPNTVASGFTISGHVSGLYPGSGRRLVLTVSNPLPYAITVTSIVTSVADASTRCRSRNVTVKSFAGALHLEAGQSAKVTVRARMAHSAPDACQGAVFAFQYAGEGTGQ